VVIDLQHVSIKTAFH